MNDESEKKVLKKPYRNYSWFVFVVVIVLAITLLQTVFQPRNEFFTGNEVFLFIFFSILGGFIAYTIIYVLGKFIFGKICKMRLISINILFIRWKRIDGKLVTEFTLPDGWGGSVSMAPNADYDQCHPILYHFGGTIFSILVMILSSSILLSIDSSKKLGYISLVVACVGLLVLVANLMPFWTDSIGDGFAIRLLLNKENRKVYFDNALQYEALLTGQGSLNPDYEYDHYNDTLQAESLIYRYYYWLNNENYEKAEAIVDLLLENKKYLSNENALIAQNAKLYFSLLRKNNDESYDYYYSLERDIRHYSISTTSLESIKTGLLVAAKVEKTYDLYHHLKKSIQKLENDYYFTLKETELKLIQQSIELVEAMYPDWKNEE